MREAPRRAALIALAIGVQRLAARLGAAFTTAVAPPSVAADAHQDFDLAACTRKQSTPQRLTCRDDSRHRRSRSGPERVQRSDPHLWTGPQSGAILCPHSWPTRWGAAVETTCRSLRSSRPFLTTLQFYCSRAHMAQSDVGVWGTAPCSWPHRGREAAPCTQGASNSSPAAYAGLPSTPRGRSVGELHKVDSAALKSGLFIFERLDLELTDPCWPNRLGDPCDRHNPTRSARFGGSV